MSWCGGSCCLLTYEYPWIRQKMNDDPEFKALFTDVDYAMDWMSEFLTMDEEESNRLHYDFYVNDEYELYFDAVHEKVLDKRVRDQWAKADADYKEAKRLERNAKRRNSRKCPDMQMKDMVK